MSPGGPDEPTEGLIEEILLSADQPVATPGQPSELLTFLFADIRGYTKFTQQRGDEAAAKLTGKFALVVRPLVAEFGGTVYEMRGDEALCLFNSPRQALRLAVALQQRFVTETDDDPTLPMTVGIGVDAGEAVLGEDGYRGGALNLAARLCAQAKAGEVLATAEVTHLARTIDGIRYVTADSLSLKGLADPVRPIRVLPEGEDPAQQISALLAASTPPTPIAPRPRWLPAPLAARPRTAAAAAVVVVAAAVTLVVVTSQGSTGTRLSALSENSVGVVDTGNGHLGGQVGVDLSPTAAAEGFGSVWVAATGASTVSRIDTSTRHVSARIRVGAAPSAIAIGSDSVWVANSGSGTVSRIDPTTNDTHTIAVGTAPGGIVVANGSVWVTNTADGTVSRIDPTRNAVADTIDVGGSPSGISAGRDIWIANSTSNTLSKIDSTSHAVVQTVHVGNDPRGVAVVGDSVWITNNLDGTVARIPTNGTSVTNTVSVGAQPTQIVAVGGRLWIAAQGIQAIAEVDPTSARLLRTVRTSATPSGLVGVGHHLWVTTTIDPSVHRGGTIRLDGQEFGSIDPDFIENIWTAWLLGGSYDGLVGFRHANGAAGEAIVPDLASAIPDPTNGGRTYTFQLRSGIRWSTGAALTVFDVKHGIERAIASGALALQDQIVGAHDCTPSRCSISGITVDPTAATVTITLTQPSGDFLGQLAIASPAVPSDTPLPQQRDPIPVTGPYQITRNDPDKLVVLTRNPYFREWSAAAQPSGFPDTIEWHVDPNGDTKRGVASVTAGQGDWADARGAGTVGALEASFGPRLYVTPTETSHGVFLNTSLAPFNDKRVRRALAYAIDRAAVAADWFTPAAITCQLLPPNFPGYRPYCPYTLRADTTGTWKAPDLATALALVKASHTQGMAVTVWSTPRTETGMRDVVSALNNLGYRARLSVITDPNADYFGFLADSRNKVQAGFWGWVADEPSASNFIAQNFRCGSFTPASPVNDNTTEFCDPSLDRLIEQATKLQSSTPAAANELWAQADRTLIDAAPWIGLVTPTWVDVVSSRVHNYERSSVLGMFFDQMWVQ